LSVLLEIEATAIATFLRVPKLGRITESDPICGAKLIVISSCLITENVNRYWAAYRGSAIAARNHPVDLKITIALVTHACENAVDNQIAANSLFSLGNVVTTFGIVRRRQR
jgi:hypothetical protein